MEKPRLSRLLEADEGFELEWNLDICLGRSNHEDVDTARYGFHSFDLSMLSVGFVMDYARPRT
jgi:hypothetical protein